MSLISRLRSVVAGDDYLDSDYDDLDYEPGEHYEEGDGRPVDNDSSLAPMSATSPFGLGEGLTGSKVVGMPGISATTSEVNLMEPRSFDEMPRAIQALRERKTVILNLTMMEPDQAQRAVDFVAGGTFAIDGHQERVGESIFLFAPSCVTVINSSQDEVSPSTPLNKETENLPTEQPQAPAPAWEDQSIAAI